MSRIAQLKETSDFLGINISVTDEDKKHTFNKICTDLIIKIYVDYKDSVFYVKNGMIYMELHNKNLWCSYELVWKVFEREYEMEHFDIQKSIKSMMRNIFKIKGFTPKILVNNFLWEGVLK